MNQVLKDLILDTIKERPRDYDLIKLYRGVKDYVEIMLDEDSLAKLSAYYIQARYSNAGLEKPSE